MKILYVCSELFPYLKTGGLADVSAGLSGALKSLGCDVRVLIPAFLPIAGAATVTRSIGLLPGGATPWGQAPVLPETDVALATLPGCDVPIYMVRAATLYARAGNPYLGPDGKDWGDNAQRFAALGWAAASIGQGLDPDWIPDVIHCHDWHAGLAPAYVRAFADAGRPTPATVFTVHNLAYQGLFSAAAFAQLGLPESFFSINGLEYYGQVSFMKAALQYADRITTVSPTYAREILTEEHGLGLDGLLRERAHLLCGILNGVDYQVWSPASDALLSVPYEADKLALKSCAKQALRERFGLTSQPHALVFGVVSRLSTQKGLHLLPLVLQELVQQGGQIALLGQGEAELEQAFLDAAARYPGQVAVHIGYDEGSAHAVVAGADVIMVPSAFEPCGLTQLYGLRYGTLPLVRRVGGLADTVVDCTPQSLHEGTATGFVFDDLSRDGLLGALQRAFALFQSPRKWASVQRTGMALRFDWRASAQHYLALYMSLRPDGNPLESVYSSEE